MNEENKYAEVKIALISYLGDYITAARNIGMNDEDIKEEVEDLVYDAKDNNQM